MPAGAATYASDGEFEHRLSDRLASLTFSDIPAPLVEQAKLFVLDAFGVMAGAAGAPAIGELRQSIGAWESGGRATLLLEGRRASPASAALANGTAAHALDFDDQHDPARIHTLCTVLPAVLAASEDLGAVSGRSLLTAIIVGAEFACRMGLCCPRSLEHGCHPTAALGGLAAAAGAARVYGLGPREMQNALSLAFVQMSGTTQSNIDGALTKRMGAGFAARNGVLSAHLARGGLGGPRRFLTGDAGLFRIHQRGDVRPEALLEGLGDAWALADLSLKPFPCCRASHAAIQVGLELHAQGIGPESVEAIEVRLGRVNWLRVGGAFAPEDGNPVVHAQFNLAYCFAQAMLTGTVDLETFMPQAILSADRGFVQRIRCLEAAEIDADSVAAVEVNLKMRDGRTDCRRRSTVKGSPQDPMTRAETISKFRSCVAFGAGLGASDTDRFVERVLALDTLPGLDALIAEFPARRDRVAARL